MSQETQNIIIRMPNWLGDAVMATPFIASVRSGWPKATLTAMCQGRNVSSLLLGNPHLNEIYIFSHPNHFLRRQEQRNLIIRLRQGKYDLGFLLPNSFSSAWWFWRGRVKTRVGFASDFRRALLTVPLPVHKEFQQEHLVVTYKRLLEPFGIPQSNTAPALYLTDEERAAASQLLAQYHIPPDATLIGVNPGAAYGSAKCWLPERFKEVIQRLASRKNTYILCLADQAGAPLVNQICEEMPSNVINLAGSTHLRELIALIERCSVFLTNDSGPMHIAAALKTPLVALFGSTSSTTTGPYKHGVVIHKHVACSPCYKRICPIGDMRCMKSIEVDEVYTAVINSLCTSPAGESHQKSGLVLGV